MKQMLRVELWKARHNPFFYLSMGIGLLICLSDVFENMAIVSELTRSNIEGGFIQNGTFFASLFIWWIACNGITWGSTFFYMVWPLLAAIPYGWAYSQEMRSGIANQYMTRSNRTQFFVAKYFVVFISGGIVVAVPVFINLLLNALICPATPLEVTGMISPALDGMFLSPLYYSHPWCFCLIWCLVEFLIGGSTATLCFIAGSRMRFSVAVILTPFVLCYILSMIGTMVMTSQNTYLLLDPLKLAMATPTNYNPEWLVFSMIFVFSTAAFLAGYWQVKHHELV